MVEHTQIVTRVALWHDASAENTTMSVKLLSESMGATITDDDTAGFTVSAISGDTSEDGDTVLVQPGTYNESLVVSNLRFVLSKKMV